MFCYLFFRTLPYLTTPNKTNRRHRQVDIIPSYIENFKVLPGSETIVCNVVCEKKLVAQ